ncbi:MAG TPA: hypothetical protein VK327_13200, partial [Candidatus Paceibacterota bacterium]|nr:hypothetical protein [Candidatus Paceibacterota bacterium]
LALAGFGLLHLLSIALISPISANRALPLRTYLTAVWIFAGFGCAFWAFKVKTIGIMAAWVVITLVVSGLAIVNVVSNHDQLSLRVRRDIPVNPAKRFLAFLFYNGAAGGLIWLGLITSATYGISAFMMHWVPGRFSGFSGGMPEFVDDFDTMVPALVLYGFAYALTALFIQRRFFSRRPPKLAGIITILLPAIWALVPNIFLFFTNRLSFHEMERNQLGNIFNVFMVKEYPQRLSHLICAGIWFALMVVLNLKWFSEQRKEFRPLEKYTGPKAAPLNAVPPRLPAETRVVES